MPASSVKKSFSDQYGEREYLSEFADDAKMLTHCAPIFMLPTGAPLARHIYDNGTVALIDTGSRRVFVTCEHVWSGFVAFRAKNRDARLVIVFSGGSGKAVFVDESSLIDSDEKLDLAVFAADFPEGLLQHKEFYRIHRFPVAEPKPHRPISFLGFPGAARRNSEKLGVFGYASFGVTVSDVSDMLIVAATTDARILRNNAGNRVPPIDIGGMSGAPAYTRSPSGGFTLVGFVRAGFTSNTDIRLSKASFLREDGSLFRPSWHPRPTV